MLGFRVWGLGFGVFVFRVSGFGFRVSGLGDSAAEDSQGLHFLVLFGFLFKVPKFQGLSQLSVLL